jgi:hypothetical protein
MSHILRLCVALSSLLFGIGWHIETLAGQLTATWVDTSADATGFSIERSTGMTGTFSEIATTDARITTYTDSTVSDLTIYCYRVRAFNTTGYSDYSNVACATTARTSGSLVTVMNQTTFSSGQTLVASVAMKTPPLAVTVNFYVGLLLPDGDTIIFFTGAGGLALGRLSDVAGFVPIVASVSLATPMTAPVPQFFTYQWTGSEPRGDYTFFFAAVIAGSLADGSVNPGDVVDVSVAPFAFP